MPPPEEKARKTIDQKLKAAGWFIQSKDELNLGVEVREFQTQSGFADNGVQTRTGSAA